MAANITTNSTANRARAAASAPAFAGLRDAWARWSERSRLRTELRSMSQRDLADLGLRESDIEDVVQGRFARP